MGEIAVVGSWQNCLMLQVPRSRGWWHCSGGKLLRFPIEWQCRLGIQSRRRWPSRPDIQSRRRWPSIMVINDLKKNKLVSTDGSGSTSSSTYTFRISTDIPLYESPGASFDRYLEDKPRVFRAIFPATQRSQRLNEEEWRIHMLPVQLLFLTVLPVVDMRLRYKSDGRDYPDGVPPDITKVLELDIIRFELQGLDDIVKPSHFSLGVKGAMYPDRQGKPSLKGQLQMSMSFDVPPVLAFVPEKIRKGAAESLLKRMVENMKHKVNGSLIADYSEFKREKLDSLV